MSMNQYKVRRLDEMTPEERAAEEAKRKRAAEIMQAEKAGRSATGEDERA